MEWSQYSRDLFDAFTGTTENVIVQACPGAGKTTNIKELWNLTDKRTVYLVFGKANQEEADAKMPKRVGSDVLTLNSLGHKAIYNTFGRVALDDRKVLNIIKKEYPFKNLKYQDIQTQQWALNKAVSQAKTLCLDSDMDTASYNAMLSDYDLESYYGMFDHMNRVLQISDDTTSVIDFNDQIRLPALYRCDMPQYHTVLGDETQDFSPIQALMVSRLDAKRYVFVGDKHQSIYGFRGAMPDSMDYLKEQFQCKELPLSITYRCAKNIVAEAARLFPGAIAPWEASPDGTVTRTLATYECGDPSTQSIAAFRSSHDGIVVCRMNRPLIRLAYTLLSHDVPCHVRGRDIGQGLIRLVNQQQATSVRNLQERLDAWYAIETEKARAKQDDKKQQSIDDKYGSLELFMSKCGLDEPATAVTDKITSMFEQGRGVCLSTVHKAKGLEAQSVYILEHDLHAVCAARARQSWQAEQERNCEYVAITRGKRELVYM